MVDPVLKQVLCPGSESAPKRQRLNGKPIGKGYSGRAESSFLPRKSPKGPKVANFPQACLKTEGSFRPKRIENGII
jgi:hypothetical protein